MLRFFTTSIIVFVCLTVIIITTVRGEDGLLDQADFELKTASDLAEVCNAPPEDAVMRAAAEKWPCK